VTETNQVSGERRHVTIDVNHHPVRIAGDDASGLEIKQVAIAQGLDIKLDFILSRKVDGEFRPVRDEQRVELRDDEFFRALSPDDDS
jgi:hypothetical protein